MSEQTNEHLQAVNFYKVSSLAHRHIQFDFKLHTISEFVMIYKHKLNLWARPQQNMKITTKKNYLILKSWHFSDSLNLHIKTYCNYFSILCPHAGTFAPICSMQIFLFSWFYVFRRTNCWLFDFTWKIKIKKNYLIFIFSYT